MGFSLLVELGIAGRLLATLEAAGARCAVFAEIAGEPKQAQLEAATEFVRRHDPGLDAVLRQYLFSEGPIVDREG